MTRLLPRSAGYLLSWLLLAVPVVAADAPAVGKLPPPVGRKVDFIRDVQPILTRNCTTCHGPDKQRGGLRLDRKTDDHRKLTYRFQGRDFRRTDVGGKIIERLLA
jgi:mono/diheme cytochrome c family protein